MRILVLAPLPFFVQRGTPIALRMLMETLAEAGHEITAIVGPDGEDVRIPRVTVTRIPGLGLLSGMPPGFSLKKLLCDLLLLPLAAWRLTRRRYDVVHAVEESAFIAMLLGLVWRVPYVCDVDSSIPEQLAESKKFPGWLVGPARTAHRVMLRRSVAALTCCRALEDRVKAEAPNIVTRTIEDTSLLTPEDGSPAPDDCAFDEKVILYVGNLEAYQGVDLLVEGFAAIATARDDARLVIVGGSPAHVARLRERALGHDGIDGKVSFLGPRPIEDLGRYLRAATIVASPRIQGENTPMKVYSYLDSGRPLLATRLLTHTQVLDDDTAMLVEPDPRAVAEGLTRLLDDAQLRARLAANAQRKVREEFSRAAFDRKLLRFYHQTLPAVLERTSRGSTKSHNAV